MPSVEYTPPREEDGKWTPGFDSYGKYWYVYFHYQKWDSAFGEAGQVRYYYRCSEGGDIITEGRINQDILEDNSWLVIFKVYEGQTLSIRLADYWSGAHYSEYATVNWKSLSSLIPGGYTYVIWGKGEKKSSSLDLFWINKYHTSAKSQTEYFNGDSCAPSNEDDAFVQANNDEYIDRCGKIIGKIDDDHFWPRVKNLTGPVDGKAYVSSFVKWCAADYNELGQIDDCPSSTTLESDNWVREYGGHYYRIIPKGESNCKKDGETIFEDFCYKENKFQSEVCKVNEDVFWNTDKLRDLCTGYTNLDLPICRKFCRERPGNCSAAIKDLCKNEDLILWSDEESLYRAKVEEAEAKLAEAEAKLAAATTWPQQYSAQTKLAMANINLAIIKSSTKEAIRVKQEYCGCFLPQPVYDKWLKPAVDDGFFNIMDNTPAAQCYFPECQRSDFQEKTTAERNCPDIVNCVNKVDIGSVGDDSAVNIISENKCSSTEDAVREESETEREQTIDEEAAKEEAIQYAEEAATAAANGDMEAAAAAAEAAAEAASRAGDGRNGEIANQAAQRAANIAKTDDDGATTDTKSDTKSDNSTKKDYTSAYIGAGIIVFILIIGAAVWLYYRNKNQQNNFSRI